MTTFYTDADVAAAGTFVESAVEVGTEFDLPAGTITRFRVPFPTPVGTTPATNVMLYNAAGTLLATVPLDTSTPDAWNWATPGSPIAVSAGLYRATIITSRYLAVSGFYASPPVTRGVISGTRGVFGTPPTSTSSAALIVDVDFTEAAGVVSGAGTADAVSTAIAIGRVRVRAAGTADAVSTASALARVRVYAAGSADATSTASASARVRVRGAGSAAAVSTAVLNVIVELALGPVVLHTTSLVRRLRTVSRR